MASHGRAGPDLQHALPCDVLQADGGTRTASVTGAYVALHLACRKIQQLGLIKEMPFKGMVAAVSCGLYRGVAVLDLDYDEDSNAQADTNFVLTDSGQIVEIQATGGRGISVVAQGISLLLLIYFKWIKINFEASWRILWCC